jgi:hypothetical protein
MVRGVQLSIGYHHGTIATGDWLVVATRGFHRILRFCCFGHDFKFAESGEDVSPSQRYQDFVHGSRQTGHSSRRETWTVWSGPEDQDYCEWIARNSFFDPVETVHENLGGQNRKGGVMALGASSMRHNSDESRHNAFVKYVYTQQILTTYLRRHYACTYQYLTILLQPIQPRTRARDAYR